MKTFALTFSLVALMISSYSQQQVLTKKWDRRFGGTLDDVSALLIQTTDKGCLLGGASSSGISGDKTQANWDTTLTTGDGWLLKIDAAGSKQWDKRFGGFNWDNVAQMQATFDGGYILGGISNSGVGGDKTQPCWGDDDYWIVKIDSSGLKQWDKRFGGVLDEDLFSLQQTKDSGFILGGFSNSPVSGDKTQPDWDSTGYYDDFWIVKTDAFGNKQWDKRFGGLQEDVLLSIVQTNDGGYMLGGQSMSGIGGDKTVANWASQYYNYWIVRIDSSGNKLWDRRYGGTGEDYLYSMIATSDGGFLLGGGSYSDISGDKSQVSQGEEDYWIIKIDSVGNKQWDKDYGGIADDAITNLAITNDGGFLLAGYSESNASGDKSENNLGSPQGWVIKTDSLGNKEWDKTILAPGYNGNTYAIQSADGCYIIGTATNGGIGGYKSQPNWDTSDLTYDYWVVKFCDTLITDGVPVITKTGAEIFVSPNPFTTDIAISIQQDGLKQATFTIYNLIGQPVYTQNETNLSSSYTKMLDLSYLPNGVYFVEVVVDGESVVREVVKE